MNTSSVVNPDDVVTRFTTHPVVNQARQMINDIKAKSSVPGADELLIDFVCFLNSLPRDVKVPQYQSGVKEYTNRLSA